jgi:hypothetical protein
MLRRGDRLSSLREPTHEGLGQMAHMTREIAEMKQKVAKLGA